MGNKLRTLFNTLFDVETKGDSTILMGNCLTFIKQCIKEADEKDTEIEQLKNKIVSLEKELKENNETPEEE